MDAEGGFVYPKIPVQRDPSTIATLASQVSAIAAVCNVEVIGIDVDTSSDIKATGELGGMAHSPQLSTFRLPNLTYAAA